MSEEQFYGSIDALIEAYQEERNARLAAEMDLEEMLLGSGDPDQTPDWHEDTDQQVIVPYDSDERRAIVEASLARAHGLWEQDIREPVRGDARGAEMIDEIIRGKEGLNWSWVKPYRKNGDFEWCGATWAWFMYPTGLSAKIRKKIAPSCYRLYAKWRKTPRHVAVEDLAPGDLMVVGRPARAKVWGRHITMVERLEETADGTVYAHTYEGNGMGKGPDGTRFEGVVRARRLVRGPKVTKRDDQAMHGYRVLVSDCDE